MVAVSILATALMDEAGQMYAVATTERVTGVVESAEDAE